MKKLSAILLCASLISPALLQAQTQPAQTAQRRRAKPAVDENDPHGQLAMALRMAKAGQYEAAANSLFGLARRPELAAQRAQMKYILGTMLMEMKLYQTAAFQFVDVIRMNDARYSKMAIEKLSVVADGLGDDTILNYAISRVDLKDFPAKLKDMVYYRMGEIKLKNNEFGAASELFSRVGPGSTYYYQALFDKGLAELSGNQVNAAIATFQKMLEGRQHAAITDTDRVAAQMALARAYYQKQDWEAAVQAYSEVPRDTLMWHDAVFEQSWAMLRAARFRSALSNFQTLHSAFYQDFYMPEGLLLRSIVYLYICKYDEMEKVLSLFEKTYGPVRAKIGDFLKDNPDPTAFYVELEKTKAIKNADNHVAMRELKLPYIATRNLLDQGDIKRSLRYLDRLNQEKARIENNPSLRVSTIGQYALKIITNRSRNTKMAVGDMAKAHLMNMRVELRDLYEQAGFIRYEMINGRKEGLKKKIAGKDIPADQIDDSKNRQFYVQNGYEYYPFQGEYWLDEIGNYHYLGKQSCE